MSDQLRRRLMAEAQKCAERRVDDPEKNAPLYEPHPDDDDDTPTPTRNRMRPGSRAVTGQGTKVAIVRRDGGVTTVREDGEQDRLHPTTDLRDQKNHQPYDHAEDDDFTPEELAAAKEREDASDRGEHRGRTPVAGDRVSIDNLKTYINDKLKEF